MNCDYSPSIEILEARIAPSVFTVTTLADSGPGSLRQALADADSPMHPGQDTIVFHLPAPPAHSENIIALTSGELTSKGNVTITGPGAGKLIVDAGRNSRVLDFEDGDTTKDSPVTISGLSLIDGDATKNSGQGGGIYSLESLTLKNVVISGNTANNGGGVDVDGTGASTGIKATLSNCLITSNSANNYAGGLFLTHLASVTISKTVVTGNVAVHFSGGGIRADITSPGTGIAITGSVISDNYAYFGGGALLADFAAQPSKITISGTKITGNTATSKGPSGGGGLFVNAGNTVITGSTINNNAAKYNGGGIEASGFSSLTISGSQINNNQTTVLSGSGPLGGGGVFLDNSVIPHSVIVHGTAKISSTQVSGNTALRGGGIYATNNIALNLANTTVSGNHALFGGGIQFSGTGTNRVDVTITGGSISDNKAGSDGGGITAFGDGDFSVIGSKIKGNVSGGNGGGIKAQVSGAVTFKNLTVIGNRAFDGGGLRIDSSDFHIIGGSITGNSAQEGGGVYLLGVAAGSILGVTISGNVATSAGGGVFHFGGGLVTLQAAKVIGNTAPTDPDVRGTFTFV